MEKKHRELKKLLEAVEKELNRKPLKPIALEKVRNYLRSVDRPKRETLDRISLFVGFQNWESFQQALHGESDASANYDTGEEKPASPSPVSKEQ